MAAMQAAAERVVKDRRRMSRADAEDIVRMEFERRGVELPNDSVERIALMFHRSPAWPFLHPLKARRERRRWAVQAQLAADECNRPPADGPTVRSQPPRS
ncbi:hypothetical protein Back2_27550 [Nocardioides baekrokdamisoli]|uniref:Uncharacterized protein n=1 Tax=Nocardioides baekrokdamisoli TaxID=1804624 RepID=A0A3G9J4A1_9ACTN|nr:hypothetical protein Back2_27550 [Nocardioides baekrokdamisoli]